MFDAINHEESISQHFLIVLDDNNNNISSSTYYKLGVTQTVVASNIVLILVELLWAAFS